MVVPPEHQIPQAASAAMSSRGIPGSGSSFHAGRDDASASSCGAVLPSDDETTPYNRWNSISNTSTSAAPSSKGGLQPKELEQFLLRTGVKRKRGAVPRVCLASSSTSGGSGATSGGLQPPAKTPTNQCATEVEDPISDFSPDCAPTCPTTAHWAREDSADPIEPFDVMQNVNDTQLDSAPGMHDWVRGLPFPSEEVIQVPVASLPSSESPREMPENFLDGDGGLDIEALNEWAFGESVRRTLRIVRHRQRHDTRSPWMPLVPPTADIDLPAPVDFPSAACLPLGSPDIDEVLAMGRDDIALGAASAASSSGFNHAAGAAESCPASPMLSEDSDLVPLIALVGPHLPVRQEGGNLAEEGPSSPASAQGLSLLQLTAHMRRMGPGGHRGERVGEAKCPGPHDMLNQIPIWTKDGQRGVLTTK
eukprot:6218852-Amphidinium_carterae.1